MTNDYGTNTSIDTNTENNNDEWKSITPNTVQDDKELQEALNGTSTISQDDRGLNVNSVQWGGMSEGAIQRDSDQNPNWIQTVTPKYQYKAYNWQKQQGMLKIIPLQQRQKFTYSTVAYIASKQEQPKTQVFPVSDVSIIPHQITFDFYDTTEGRIGVSNAVEKHMSVECDIYVTDLIAQYWIFGEDNQYDIGLSKIPNYKKKYWDAVENKNYLNFEGDLEKTKAFAEFRATFLQQHSGWVCRFVSSIFGVFTGVITDVSYQIGNGESFAKWHIKLEEALFTSDYQETGQKPASETSSDGSTTNSGTATDIEDIGVEANN